MCDGKVPIHPVARGCRRQTGYPIRSHKSSTARRRKFLESLRSRCTDLRTVTGTNTRSGHRITNSDRSCLHPATLTNAVTVSMPACRIAICSSLSSPARPRTGNIGSNGRSTSSRHGQFPDPGRNSWSRLATCWAREPDQCHQERPRGRIAGPRCNTAMLSPRSRPPPPVHNTEGTHSDISQARLTLETRPLRAHVSLDKASPVLETAQKSR
jgi:hypothetical protein